MEILILGIILVIVMVIVSTKIKKAAATAFEAEVIEKDEFRVSKPAGFMYPINAENEFAYEAYSKTYGERGTRNIWRARTRLRVSDGLNIRKLVSEIKKGSETAFSEKVLDDLSSHQIGSIVRTDFEVDEIRYKILRKIVADKKLNKTFELKTTLICPYEDEFTEAICEMMYSFEVSGES